jgi:hypothetical protein
MACRDRRHVCCSFTLLFKHPYKAACSLTTRRYIFDSTPEIFGKCMEYASGNFVCLGKDRYYGDAKLDA